MTITIYKGDCREKLSAGNGWGDHLHAVWRVKSVGSQYASYKEKCHFPGLVHETGGLKSAPG